MLHTDSAYKAILIITNKVTVIRCVMIVKSVVPRVVIPIDLTVIAFIITGGLKEFEKRHSDLCFKRLDADRPQRPLCSPTSPIVEAGIDTATITEILPYLYLGKCSHVN